MVGQNGEPCINSSTNPGIICIVHLHGPKEPCITCGTYCLYLANRTEQSVPAAMQAVTGISAATDRHTDRQTDRQTSHMGTMRHFRSGKNMCAKRTQPWPCCCFTAASAASMSKRVDSGSRQTLLVLQFVIEFANIWAQYSPSTYTSTHVGFFWFVP